MRVRHRTPSIFTLSMVDMLCCCMGCIILVWLLGAKQSEDSIHDAKAELEKQKQDANTELAKLRGQIADLELQRAAAQAEVEAQTATFSELERKWKDATGQIASLKADVTAREKDLAAAAGRVKDLQPLADLVPGLRSQLKTSQDQYAADEAKVLALEKDAALRAKDLDDATRKLLAAQKDAALRVQDLDDAGKKLTAAQAAKAKLETDLNDATKSLTVLQATKTKLETDLADRNKELTLLRPYKDKWTADEQRVLALQKDLDASRKDLLAAQNDLAQRTRDLDDVGKKFVALQLLKAKADADLDDRAKELTLLRPFKDKLTADDEQVASLRKDLADARRSVVALQAEKATWQNTAARTASADSDNRFAGIQLVGRRVIFLVDMSGSMVYLDDNTPAPQKWVEVHKTVGRIMRSLPELEKYQVIAFSDRTHFPLGGDGKWLDYDPRSSADLVLQTLGDVKPDGGTNMYTAMQAAFAYRKDGLDAIYLLSDGLPNLGEGVRPEEVNTLTELERGARLSAVIRKTLKTDWNRDLAGKPRVHINTVGFFYESPDVGAFLWALARENDGGFVGMSKP